MKYKASSGSDIDRVSKIVLGNEYYVNGCQNALGYPLFSKIVDTPKNIAKFLIKGMNILNESIDYDGFYDNQKEPITRIFLSGFEGNQIVDVVKYLDKYLNKKGRVTWMHYITQNDSLFIEKEGPKPKEKSRDYSFQEFYPLILK